MFNRKQTRVVVTAVVLLTHLTFISMKCPVTHGATSKFQVAGRWQGKFPLPDDNSISEDDNPIAVEVTVKEESGKLSGVAVFYVIRNKDNKPQVVGKTEADLIDLQFRWHDAEVQREEQRAATGHIDQSRNANENYQRY